MPAANLLVPTPPYRLDLAPGAPIASLLDREWLITSGNGGFAMGTALGVNRRKYHALLNASPLPPVERITLLNALDEEVVVGREPGVWIASHRWATTGLEEKNLRHLKRFEKEPTCARWVYEVHGVEIVKELRLGWRRNSCAVRYTVRAGKAKPRPAVRMRVLPMVTIRDFHATLPVIDIAAYTLSSEKRIFRIGTVAGSTPTDRAARTLHIACDHGKLTQEPTTRDGIRYDLETERNQADLESYFNPGFFEVVIPEEGDSFSFTITASLDPERPDPALFDDRSRDEHLAKVNSAWAGKNPAANMLAPLAAAGDDFLVQRIVAGKTLMTVIAGYPWFSDWGRDTMISLVGLMLTTGRYADALGCLETFARHVDKGMIPNRFDDYGGPPEYNTIDASLWFLHACHEYVRTSGDRAAFDSLLKPACLEIIDHYLKGTRDGIRVDPSDGLVIGGDDTTQLTWMDAKRDGIVFTPRHGKPIEISALWHHGLLCIASLIEQSDARRAAQLKELATKAGASIRDWFWNAAENRLNDCLQLKDGRWQPVPEVRPNQLFAVSLEHSALTPEQKLAVVACCNRELLTPMGLRTLSPKDKNFRPRFTGDMMTRDAAYHNGTVWPWLIGPYCEALLRANGFSEPAKAEVREAIKPLLAMFNGDSVGQLFEVYDGDGTAARRQMPGGCMAQAWSVAELLRIAAMVA